MKKYKFEHSSLPELIAVIAIAVLISVGISLILTFPILWIWNWVAGMVALPQVTYWQMAAIVWFLNLVSGGGGKSKR